MMTKYTEEEAGALRELFEALYDLGVEIIFKTPSEAAKERAAERVAKLRRMPRFKSMGDTKIGSAAKDFVLKNDLV